MLLWPLPLRLLLEWGPRSLRKVTRHGSLPRARLLSGRLQGARLLPMQLRLLLLLRWWHRLGMGAAWSLGLEVLLLRSTAWRGRRRAHALGW